MTPERLARLQSVSRDGFYLTIAEALELCDEVDRLRSGIEGIKAKALDHQKIITEGPLVGRILVSHWCDKALLNPTEGDD